MIFGKIDYINLLPFHIFLKASSLPNAFKQGIEYKKGVPSTLNGKLRRGKIDAAIISSVESQKSCYTKLDLGIVAYKKVDSVLVKKNSPMKFDSASATSNALSSLLCIKGEVLIGDRALKAYLNNPNAYIDLASVWYEKTHLPFVFARLCVRKNRGFYDKLARCFVKQKVKIPQYILEKYANSRGIEKKEIIRYLKLIHYGLGTKEKRALHRFLKEAK